MSKKKTRKHVIRYLDHKRIGNKIYVDRIKLEELVKREDVESFPLDQAKTPSVTKADGAAFFLEKRSEKQCRHLESITKKLHETIGNIQALMLCFRDF